MTTREWDILRRSLEGEAEKLQNELSAMRRQGKRNAEESGQLLWVEEEIRLLQGLASRLCGGGPVKQRRNR